MATKKTASGQKKKRKPARPDKLNKREELFVQCYLADPDLNAERAALKAGYAPGTAKSNSYRWACEDREKCPESKRHVWDAIRDAISKRSEDTGIDAKYVLVRLHQMDQLDPIDILEDDLSGFRPLSEWPREWRISISGIDMAELFEGQGNQKKFIGMLKKIKWPDKVKNLELLGKHVDVNAYKEIIDASVGGRVAVLPMPTADNVDDWEAMAQKQQKALLAKTA